MEVAPFTGKVPMPPGHSEGSAVEGSPQKSAPGSLGSRPAAAAVSSPVAAPKMAPLTESVIATPETPPSPLDGSLPAAAAAAAGAAGSGGEAPEHVFTPIVTPAPSSATPSTATWAPNARVSTSGDPFDPKKNFCSKK